MIRSDHDLAFILQFENIAWYEDGKVRILDRRVYPQKVQFVVCSTYGEVAQAIADMVTQSGGPYTAAGMGMALAAYESRNMKENNRINFLKKAASTLSNARPTTSKKMSRITDECLTIAYKAMKSGNKVDEAIFNLTLNNLNDKYIRIDKRAKLLVDLFPNRGTIMTQCFAETIVGLMLRESKRRKIDIKLICPETRPFFQGARLTASVAQDQDIPVTVITDNMPAHLMSQGKIDIFTSAADIITLDGHVINKIGNLQIALAAHNFNIPYYVSGNPDPSHRDISTVQIEERDGKDVLESMGIKTTMEGVRGYYPAFDITPTKLVSSVITDNGVFSPYDLERFEVKRK